MGGWLSVRGPLRYSRISAGICNKEPVRQVGQTIVKTSDPGIYIRAAI